MGSTFLSGDCRIILPTMPAESIDCIVTSPPYYGLRDYGTARWEGGNPACDHVVGQIKTGLGLTRLGTRHRGGGHKAGRIPTLQARETCPHCGARRQDRQIGREATRDRYIEELVTVFRELWRVLKPTGTVWLNLGDSYVSQQNPCGSLKPKNLMGLPWRVALALQAEGWLLRSDIVWHKPNPMPENIQDRPAKAHEYLFLLTRSDRYFWGRNTGGPGHRSVWTIASRPFPEAHFATFPPELVATCIEVGCPPGGTVLDPFSGAGTTAMVADRLRRDAIGIELDPESNALAERRMARDRLERGSGTMRDVATARIVPTPLEALLHPEIPSC